MKLTAAYTLLAQMLGHEDVSMVLDFQREAILAAMNMANQEVWDKGPAEQRNELRAGVAFAPTNAPGITLTQNSDVISGTVQPAWVGCTVSFSGQELNEFLSPTKLLAPYLGQTGVQTGLVYGDSIVLANDVEAVTDNVTLNGQERLRLLASLEEWQLINRVAAPGRPTHFWVQPATSNNEQVIQSRIRLAPRPNRAYLINYEVRKRAPRYDATHLTDPLRVVMTLGDEAESIWLPIAKFHLRDHPHFDTSRINLVTQGYQLALQRLHAKTAATGPRGSHRIPYGTPPSKR
jgi:hypothetical protein